MLCRLALRDDALDAWSFTALRILSGAALLAPVLLRRAPDSGAPWRPAAGLALLTYALAFSFAYRSEVGELVAHCSHKFEVMLK